MFKIIRTRKLGPIISCFIPFALLGGWVWVYCALQTLTHIAPEFANADLRILRKNIAVLFYSQRKLQNAINYAKYKIHEIQTLNTAKAV